MIAFSFVSQVVMSFTTQPCMNVDSLSRLHASGEIKTFNLCIIMYQMDLHIVVYIYCVILSEGHVL